jgi:hypothetical protein
MKWLPEPSEPTWEAPRSQALRETVSGALNSSCPLDSKSQLSA